MDGWSVLPPPVISDIATALKKTPRWRQSGSSLRLLNKHWSQAIDSNIFEVRPGRTRRVDAKDLASLLKFPCLSTVDVSSFLSFERRLAEASSEACSSLSSSVIFLSNLEYVVDILVRLPLLRSLEVDCEIAIGSLQCNAKASKFFWSKLSNITSILVYFVRNPKRDEPGFYLLNPTLRSQSLIKFCTHHLQTFANAFTGLEVLQMHGFFMCVTGHDTFLFEIPATAKDFHLVGVSLQRNCKVDASCITSLSVRGPGMEELHWIANLPQLKKLHIADLDVDTYSTLQISGMFEKLEVLEIVIYPGNRRRHLPDALFASLRQLRVLRLDYLAFDGKALEGKLPELRVLGMIDCAVADDHFSFVLSMKNLKSLTLSGSQTSSVHRAVLPMLAQLTDLRSLFLIPMFLDEILHHVAGLANLEVLGLSIRQSVTVDGLRQLHRLSNLCVISLHVDHEQAVADMPHSLDLLTSLQTLYVNDRIWSRYHDESSEFQFKQPRTSIGSYHNLLRQYCLI